MHVDFNKLEFNTKRNVIKYDFEVINRPQNVEKSSDSLNVTEFTSNETQTKNILSSKVRQHHLKSVRQIRMNLFGV